MKTITKFISETTGSNNDPRLVSSSAKELQKHIDASKKAHDEFELRAMAKIRDLVYAKNPAKSSSHSIDDPFRPLKRI